MQIRIKKEIEIVVDVPEKEAANFFGDNPTEYGLIQWADGNDVRTWDEDSENPQSWVNYENLKEIEIIDKPKELECLKDKYSEKWVDYIKEEIDRDERCFECEGYGDDYDQNMNCNCDSCPFNEPIDPPSEDE